MGASVRTGHSEKLQSNARRPSAGVGLCFLQKKTVVALVLRLDVFLGAAVTWGTCTLPIFSLNVDKRMLCAGQFIALFLLMF